MDAAKAPAADRLQVIGAQPQAHRGYRSVQRGPATTGAAPAHEAVAGLHAHLTHDLVAIPEFITLQRGMMVDGPVDGRCFVGFFGLNRSLRWTAPSIRRNILAPLRAAGFAPVLAAHFNQPAVINHPASNERAVKVRRDLRMSLPFDLQWIEPQQDANIAELVEPVFAVPFRDYDDPTGGTRRNILHQLHSLRRLRSMASLLPAQQFDTFLLLRPDIEYIDPIDIDGLKAVARGDVDMVSPSWHQYGGLNDRFAFCNRKAADAFMSRWDHVASHCQAHGYIHPETLLAEAIQKAGIRLRTTDQRALRVRATGETLAEGFRLGTIPRVAHHTRPLLRTLGLA